MRSIPSLLNIFLLVIARACNIGDFGAAKCWWGNGECEEGSQAPWISRKYFSGFCMESQQNKMDKPLDKHQKNASQAEASAFGTGPALFTQKT
jgi:hypothetical protein